MEVSPKEIRSYLSVNGINPFSEWFDSLRDIRAKAKIRARLDRVEAGNLGDCKSVGDGVFELRIDYGSGYRIYFGQQGSTVIILLCGGDKSTQDKDIAKAKEYWEDYRSRDDA
ncbi:MAG: type II toxin-antitoxin system RelE/ParE family toxin [Nostoc sp. CmiVER01]|uniref:type II toxin-antitoxin system RelE/ParE family toxin n=1 Tax=Nostoc sp. CmiVER01 TaxID=3075384 RepID=UPI002AD2E303|nr:type II toxin-antitoxin system RelE/ParE family toxin [Nostoc sp. CmiVER01]MDZ8121605.1 type II toxin-antitoxin system RelE/ParE family toxin [Nostoc sp. CmiVER01]